MTSHPSQQPPDASVTVTRDGARLHLALAGHLDTEGTARLWDEAVTPVREAKGAPLEINGAGITYLNGVGVGLLLMLKDVAEIDGGTVTLTDFRDKDRNLINLTWDAHIPPWHKEKRGLAESVGVTTGEVWHGLRDIVSFVGELSALLVQAMLRPRQVRWRDVLLSGINVGVESLFIIVLIGFLMGLIMSFQSAISLQRFGGEIFVPNMLGLVMFREMGPLVTCILLAARSGSAFAAEIGTMKINEELDALTTMGLSPMKFLVVPKLIATMLVVPLMTMFFNLASLVGGAVVMLSMGYPLVTFTSRVFSYLSYDDFWGGMAKCLVFSFLVAGVGCLRGIQTKSGASAVGLSTTSAVVSGIILIAFADGLFAMAFYYLGI